MDNGKSWSTSYSLGNNSSWRLWGNGPGTVYGVGVCLTCLAHSDGFMWMQTRQPFIGKSDVWGSSDHDVYATGGGLVHTDGATDWLNWGMSADPVNNFVSVGISGTGPDDIYVVGEIGTIFHGTNGGTTWNRQVSNVSVNLRDVWVDSLRNAYVVGDSGTLLRSGDQGATWQALSIGVDQRLTGVWGSAPNDVYVIGDGGTIFHSTDQGMNWTREPVPPGVDHLNAIWGSAAGDIFVVGDVVLHKVHAGI